MSFISKIFGKRDVIDASSYNAGRSLEVCDAREGNELAVRNLVNRGVDINMTGGGTLDFSPLMWAAEDNNIDMLRLLLATALIRTSETGGI
jgi:hypothetical protein